MENAAAAPVAVSSSTNSYLPIANNNVSLFRRVSCREFDSRTIQMQNGYDLSNPIPTDPNAYSNPATNNYQNTLTGKNSISSVLV
jgi:hypothetical protein